jgi:hypothetical protein
MLRTRVERLERAAPVTVSQSWWLDFPDHVQEPPSCWFVSNAVEDWRAGAGLEPIDALRRRDGGLPPRDDGRAERLRWLTAAAINHWATENGLPPIPLTDVSESANAAGHYVVSQHSRPVYALAGYAHLMLLTEAEQAILLAQVKPSP